MKTSAVEDYLHSKAFTQSGNAATMRVWNTLVAVNGSFALCVRRRGGRAYTTLTGDNPVLDFYYGKPLYKLRVYPKLPIR